MTQLQGDYDVIVIGAGPVGENLADRTVQGGLRTVIVESELIGGECSYWACMPSKALLRSSSALAAARRVAGAREAVGERVDAAAVLERRTSFTSGWDDAGQADWLARAGIDLVRGHGRLVDERTVEVTGPDATRTLHARHAIAVCTGSRALVPDLPGLRAAEPWTNREAVAVTEVPGSLAVIGGGVVGCELATAFASLGCAVTMLVRGEVLSGQEPIAGSAVAESLAELGVDVRRGVSATAVERGETGVVITCDDGRSVTAAELLVATGRGARSDDLGLAVVGLADGDWLRTDETLRVLDSEGRPIEWLVSAGDVNGRSLLTHQGKYQARAAGDAIVARAAGTRIDDGPWGIHTATADHHAVPQVIFTDPEVATVGLTVAGAAEERYRTRVVDIDLGTVAGAALHADGYAGAARMVVDEDRGVLLGATFVGQDVAELLHSATIAVVGQVPLDRLWHAVPSYPTISEVWLRLLESYGRPTTD